jgi:non-specific serine/threonine protein kinase
LLTAGSRTALPRHQTLRAAIDWSYDLLTEPERVLLRRLVVFAGGCTLEAVEQVCADEGGREGIVSSQILDLLSHLVNKSVVIAQTDVARYGMLETIRQYGYEKLAESGEAEMIHQRHLDWLIQFAKAADPKLRGAEMSVWARRIDDELDNIRTTLEWGFEHGQSSKGAELVGALTWYNFLRSNDREAKRWAEKAENLTRDAPSPVRAEVLFALGVALYDLVELEKAEAVLQQALTHYRALDNQWRVSFVLNTLGLIKALQAKLAEAEQYYQEALTLRRATGDSWGITHTLQNLGGIAESKGDYATAKAIYEEGLKLSEELGDARMIARRLADLGGIAFTQGDLKQADALLRRAVSGLWHMGEKFSLFQAIPRYAQVIAAEGQPHRAANMLGAMEFAREDLGIPLSAVSRADLEKVAGMIRNQLGEAEFRKTWAEGHAMTLEQAIEYGLESPHEPAAQPRTSRQAMKQQFGGLTEREREVAVRIAQGESNREVAEGLVVSERTVESHVTNILNKLGFTSRAQIRKWAAEKALVSDVKQNRLPS